ncbi:MAG: ArsR family transcriptional regulator [Nitriliruptorales bacterium]|nr:ArsR family transcriptional regulator [Nitriliruptorales bacterium]
MNVETIPLESRAAIHRALGDAGRLAIVDALALSDRTVGELEELTGLGSSLLGFHLRVLDDAGVVHRRPSDGDRRRRYVRLDPAALSPASLPRVGERCTAPLFVCTHNSARSQFAAALWRQLTGGRADSAGSQPANAVHPLAVTVARRHGLDLADARPRAYTEVQHHPDLIVSVCDRALEAGVPFDAPRVHWSVSDPTGGDEATFVAAFDEIAQRVARLVEAAA